MFIEYNDITDLTPEQICHLYALIAWNGKTFDEAKNNVMNLSIDELNNLTYAQSSIDVAKQSVEDNLEELQGKNRYKVIIKILSNIHDKWVIDNAKKYNRDIENNDKRIFQHLPTALIGLDELAKDMMFLQPFLKGKGIFVGKMNKNEYGSFIPTQEIAEAYNLYVSEYLKHCKQIYKTDSINSALCYIIDNYKALNINNSEIEQKRIEYLKERSSLLIEQVKKYINSKNYIKDEVLVQK